jgi:undecaprenyl-diphosphatase
VLDLALKYAFHRQRPIPYFGSAPTTFSFPSGHSLFSFCFFGTLAGLMATRTSARPLKVIIYLTAALLIFSIGLSRIYLGVHYPTDVVVGYLAAGIWVTTVVILDRWRIRRKSNR